MPDEAGAQNDYEHRRLDRSFGRKEEESVEDIVKKLKERHGRQATQRYDADSDNIPQRLLMPGVNDPSLWRIKVRVSQHCSSMLTSSLVVNNPSLLLSSARFSLSSTRQIPSKSSPSFIVTLYLDPSSSRPHNQLRHYRLYTGFSMCS